MSFSSDVKDELKKIIPEKEHCIRAEMAGIMLAGGRESYPKSLQDLLALLESRLECKEFDLKGKEILQRPCCKRAYIRGVFLSCGSLSDPEKMYHLELVFMTASEARDFRDLLKLFNISTKIIERKERYVVYLKEGDVIADFLTLTGAVRSLLNLQNIRVVKDVRNNVNRQVNCETANLSKTIAAGLEQRDVIKRLKDNKLFESLPLYLQELGELRMQFPERSLKELGEMMDPPVSKSGVNHRMRKIMNFQEEEKL